MLLSNKNHKERNICFVSLTAYNLLSEKSSSDIIGPDLNNFYLAKELIARGYNVKFLTYDVGGPKNEIFNQIHVIKSFRSNANMISKIIYLFKTVINVNSDIYFHYGGFFGLLSFIPFIMGKKSVYRVGSDAFVDRSIIKKSTKEFNNSRFSIHNISNYLNLKLSSAIVVQTKRQEDKLKTYKEKLFVINNNLPIITNRTYKLKPQPPIILWVGSMAEVKQPHLFIELAKRIPEAEFQMIGGHTDYNKDRYDRIKIEAEKLSNFKFLGVVEFDEINKYYESASLLVNTSLFEGYPNSFIQAWNNYTPVVTLNADLDGIISEHSLGLYSGSFDQLVKDVMYLVKNKQLIHEYGLNGNKYVSNHFIYQKIIDKYVVIFNKLVKSD